MCRNLKKVKRGEGPFLYLEVYSFPSLTTHGLLTWEEESKHIFGRKVQKYFDLMNKMFTKRLLVRIIFPFNMISY